MQSHDGRAGITFREILAAWAICSALYLLIALAPLATTSSDRLQTKGPQEAKSLDLTETRE